MNFTESNSSGGATPQIRTERVAQQTTAEKLAEAVTTAEMLAENIDTILSTKLTKEGALVTKHWDEVATDNPDNSISGSATFGQYHLKPNFVLKQDGKGIDINIGISGELTEAQIKQKVVDGAITAQVTGTLNTVNGQLKLEGKASLTERTLSGGFIAGAKAMVLDGKLEATVKTTPKTIIDEVAKTYNNHIDPLVDAIAGTDMPGIPEAPDSWDKGVIVSGHVEGGTGAALQGGFRAGVNSKIPSIQGHGKARLGLVRGFGAKLVGTW